MKQRVMIAVLAATALAMPAAAQGPPDLSMKGQYRWPRCG